MITVYVGAFINPKSFSKVDFINHGMVSVDDQTGRINSVQQFESAEALQTAITTLSTDHKLVKLSPEQFLTPGFIDMHTHAPQYRNLGLGLDYTLLEWLQKVTFPEERSYARQPHESPSEHNARVAHIYGHMVRHYLRYGTTTCCYFGGLHAEANRVLVQQVVQLGQRALIGKTCMDCNSPSDYVESTADSVQATREFVEYVKKCDASLEIPGRVLPVVTPRFALTCSRDSMEKLAEIAISTDVHIQTHMSENLDEIQFSKELFPECHNYASIYSSVGLLTRKTFLAHCVHLNEAQRALLSNSGTAVSHCPTSNFALNSGVADLRALAAAGIPVGLGSDVSGGYGLSILDAMRQAIIASKTLHFSDQKSKPLTVSEAFFLATRGGAEALSIDVGSFEEGNFFDALLVDMTNCPSIRHQHETLEQSLHRFVFLGDDRWIRTVFVNGTALL
ncbi:Guanine deaminase [Paramicrosporidium saccamoebae]|uniref:Guanine deaminase n=1 Tax=Paramicrosporidium saccamoebae TaxID=1246581 RepID=A0A2H9TKD7_9FUNG|nr:Guanine deaminase [Paramicrosporidium saccamoebae]